MVGWFALLIGTLAAAQAAPELVVVNQTERTVEIVDTRTGDVRLTARMGERPHEAEVSPGGRYAAVPIYGSGAVGRPGTDGDSVEFVDLADGAVTALPLGRGVRPHDARFGADGLLYVTAEVGNTVMIVDPAQRRVVGEITTGQAQSHALILSPDGRRAYTANVSPGSISVLDLERRALIGSIPLAERVQRITISPDGRTLYTHDQRSPRVLAIDPERLALADAYLLPGLPFVSAAMPDGKTLVVGGRPEQEGSPSRTPVLYILDLPSRAVRTVDLPGWPRVVIPDGNGHVWANLGSGEVVRVDLAEGRATVLARLKRGLDGMAVRRR